MEQSARATIPSSRKRNRTIILIFVFVALLFGVFGSMYYHNEKRTIRQNIADELKTIAWLKSDQLADWYAAECEDVDLIAGNGILIESLQSWLSTGSSKDRGILSRYISSLKREHAYEELFLYSPDDQRVVFPDDGRTLANSVLRRLADSAAVHRCVLTTDVYLCTDHKTPHIDFIAPIRVSRGGTPLVLVARFDPYASLFPLIEKWPTTRNSAETYIVRADKDSLLILSNLRHGSIPALTLGINLNDTSIAAVRGIRKPHALAEGIDYRKQRVFSQVSVVHGTPWYIVAELDVEEAMGEFFFEVKMLAGMIVLLLAVLATAYALFYSHRQREMLQRLYSLQLEYHTILLGIPDAVITTDAQGLIRHLNPAAELLTEWKQEDARGKPFDILGEFVTETDGKAIESPVVRLLSRDGDYRSSDGLLFLSGSGKRIPILESASVIQGDGDGVIGAVILLRDQTGPRARQRQIEENESKFRSLFETTSDAIAVYDLVPHEGDEEFSAVLTDCNERFAALLQQPVSALIGKRIEEVKVVEGDTLVEALRKAKATNAPLVTDLHAKELGKYFVLAAFTPAPHRAALAFHDVTERKQAEEALNEKVRELERFNRLIVDRELRMIELKAEVNFLLQLHGESPRYGSVE